MEFKQRELPISVEQDTQGEQLAFITGFDKSGTTWMRDMFDAHPQIYCKSSGQFFDYHEPEQHFLAKQGGYRDIVNAVLGLRWYSMSGHTWVRKSGVEQMARALILRAMLAHGKGSNVRLIVDKSTVQDCALIREIFPAARIVALVRDGRDVSVSFAHQFRRKGSTNKITEDGILQPKYLRDVAAAWARYSEHLMQFAAVDSAFHMVRYEDLLADTQAVMAEVWGRLGVDADAGLVSEIVKKTSFERMSGGRRPGEEDQNSFHRKGVAGDWVNYYSYGEAAVFEECAGDVLRKLGYEQGSDWVERRRSGQGDETNEQGSPDRMNTGL